MTTQADYINKLISQGKIKNAISVLNSALGANQQDELKSDLIALSARFSNNERKKRIGVVGEVDYQLEWNKILSSLTSIVQEYQNNINQTDLKSSENSNGNDQTVFISYNHKDQDIAIKLKDALIERGMPVIMDVDSMRAGHSIKEFIEQSVANASTTMSVVSNASLLSSWVGMETIHSFFNTTLDKKKKFIACYIEDDFFKREFTLKAVDKIDVEIAEIEQLISKYGEKKLDTGDLNAEKTRLYDLRNNMNKIIERLRNSLCLDIRGNKFDENLPKIVEAIQITNRDLLK